MSEATKPARGKRTLIWIILGFLVVAGGMYVWKEVSLALFGRSATRERRELIAQHDEQQAEVRRRCAARTAQLLELTALPLGWAIRTEAIAQDYAQIEEYMVHLVKRPTIARLAFITPDGMIKIATDKKLEGENASRFFENLQIGEEVTLRRDEAGVLQLLVPILGYNAKLGSLIVTFDAKVTEC